MSADFLDDLKYMGKKVAEKLEPVEKALSEGKKSFGRALVDATNLQPADMRSLPAMKESQADLREYAANAADAILPGTADALPFGKVIAGAKVAKKVVEGMKRVEPANLPEMTRKGYDLLSNKAPKAQSIGKVIVKDAKPMPLGKIVFKP